jgi:anti-sigma B factor antagonist
MGLTLCICPDDHGTIVRIGGEIDTSVEEALGDCLLRIMRAHTARLLLDLSAVTFFDCAGLRTLMQARRRAELRNGAVDLIDASKPVRRIVDLAGLQDVFPVRDARSREMAHAGDDTWTSPAQAL